ncbi:MAG: ABC transporter permease, partial [Hyphomicrobiales bacterium]|nr:ABC transporter permease [Hyphomicrobiales bacterium]
MILSWIRASLSARPGATALAAIGIVAATALMGAVGVHAVTSARSMTARALSALPVDWQVAVAPGADAAAIRDALPKSGPVKVAQSVGYADVAAFRSATGDTVQVTGGGQALGLPPGYATEFPGQVRTLAGTTGGVALFQQTASNLHVGVGDTVTVTPRVGAPFDVKVDGVVDLPNIDATFQAIGPAKGPTLTAPPDNVALLPMATWRAHFEAGAAVPGGGARYQIHARLDRAALPVAPDAAYVAAAAMSHNVELRAAGLATVGDDLAARLGAIRKDALFADILLWFLGLPGVALALAIANSVARADSPRRTREQALLALRGASTTRIAASAAGEAATVAALGAVLGVAAGALIARFVLGADPADPSVASALLFAGGGGFVAATAAALVPALRDLAGRGVAERRAWHRDDGASPIWKRLWLDAALLALAAAIFLRSAGTGYQVVLAPEGVPATSVDYVAFLAPLALWLGGALLAMRLTSAALRHGVPALTRLIRPFAGAVAAPAAATLSRRRRRVAAGAALVALAVAFAVSTSLFNATYQAQGRVDAELTNGADVAVTGTTAAPAGDAMAKLAALPGVAASATLQHRYAYVGKDLQDLFGIDVKTIGGATKL